MKNQFTAAFFIGALVQCTFGQLSLYIPGFDPQPISAIELGAGSDGRTTWLIEPGSPTGTFTAPDFLGTATLIAGPNDAHIIMSVDGLSADEQCRISGGLADCTVVIVQDGVTSTDVDQETVSPFVVQGGTAAPAPTSGPGLGTSAPGSPTSAPSGGSSVSAPPNTSSGGSSSTSGAPSPSQSTNGAVGMGVVDRVVLLGTAGIGMLLSLV